MEQGRPRERSLDGRGTSQNFVGEFKCLHCATRKEEAFRRMRLDIEDFESLAVLLIERLCSEKVTECLLEPTRPGSHPT